MTGKGGSTLYEPAEDTFLLAKGVSRLSPLVRLAAEIGCGKGLITEVLAEHAEEVVATDLDYSSCKVTWQRAKGSKLDGFVHVICCDRLEAVRTAEIFDFIAFNPPYLPEEDDPRWAGGPTGTETPLAFASSASKRLKTNGQVLLVLSSLSNWMSALLSLRSIGYVASVIRVERVGVFEDLLLVLCIKRALNAGNPYPNGVAFKIPITD